MRTEPIIKILASVCFLCLLGQNAHAQWYKWHVGAGAGSMTYFGDLSDRFVNINLQQAGYHAFVERQLKGNTYLRLESSNGNILGSDRAAKGWINRGFAEKVDFERSLNFRTKIHDANLSVVFYLIRKGEKQKSPFLNPYVRAGVGVGFFDVYGDLINNSTGDIYHYWSDLSLRDLAQKDPNAGLANLTERDNAYETNLRELAIEKEYNRFKWQIPVAFGLKMRLSENVGLTLEAQYTYAMTDYLDNVGDLPARSDLTDAFAQYAADPAGFIGTNNRGGDRRKGLNDSYLYLNAGLVFNIGSTLPPKFKSPVFYPGHSTSFIQEDTLPVYKKDTALFTTLPMEMNSSELIEISNDTFKMTNYDWQYIRAIAMSYEEKLDSLYYDSLHIAQDNLLKKDLQSFTTFLPSSSIPSNVKVDSMLIQPIQGDSSKLIVQYFISIPQKSNSVVSSAKDSVSISKIETAAFVYRVDTLAINDSSFQLPKAQLMVKSDDGSARMKADSVFFTTVPISSAYRVPLIAGADTGKIASGIIDSLRKPNNEVGLKLEHLNLAPVAMIKAPNFNFSDTLVQPFREKTTYEIDTTLIKSVNDLKARIEQLQLSAKSSFTAEDRAALDEIMRKVSTKPDTQVVVQKIKAPETVIQSRTDTVKILMPSTQSASRISTDTSVNTMNQMLNNLAAKRTAFEPYQTAKEPEKLPEEKLSRAERKAQNINVGLPIVVNKDKSSKEEKRANKEPRTTPIFVAYSSKTPYNKAGKGNAASSIVQADSLPKMDSITASLSTIADSSLAKLDSLGMESAMVVLDTLNNPTPDSVTVQKNRTTSLQDSSALNLKAENDLLKQELAQLKSGQDSIMAMMSKMMDKITGPAPIQVTMPASVDPLEFVLAQVPVKVFFGVGQSTVANQYRSSLDALAQQLRQYPELNVSLKGFADPTGNAASNIKLSEKRAAAVKQYLVQTHKINANKLLILSPEVETNTQDNSFSRRVEVQLVR